MIDEGNSIFIGGKTLVISYQDKDYFSNDSHNLALYLKDKSQRQKRTQLYLVSALYKSLQHKYSWGNSISRQKIQTDTVQLPSINGEIAFSYMENYIKTLEAERIETLEAYLTVTGLKDYHLTKNDEKILDTFTKLTDTESRVEYLGTYTQFELNKVFEWVKGVSEINPLHLDDLEDLSQPFYPFYGQSTTNNGIISYRRLRSDVLNNTDALPTLLIHSNNQNMVYLESPFYLKDGHGATSVLQSPNLNRYTALYFITTTKKVIEKRFNYNAKATKIGLKQTQIELPVSDAQPDYTFMSDFIKVIEKLVIKDLVEWTDKKIQATKEVVAQP